MTKIDVLPRDCQRRVNRALKPRGERLFRARGKAKRQTDWYTVNLEKGTITNSEFELEQFSREVGALRPWERLAEE